MSLGPLLAAILVVEVLALPAAKAQDKAQGTARDAAKNDPITTQAVSSKEIHVLTGFSFRVGNDTFQLSGMRGPRIARAQCFYEKRRGRAAQRALRRLLAREPVEITRTGSTTARGIPLVRVVADGVDVRSRMIALGHAWPRTGQRVNPWCVKAVNVMWPGPFGQARR